MSSSSHRPLGLRPAHRTLSVLLAGSAVAAFGACSGDEPVTPVVSGVCADAGRRAGDRLPGGDPVGHAAPQGAKAAGQARAGRVTSGTQIRAPKNPRARVKIGDYLLANDKIALYIGNEALSDGMSMYGGEILALEPVAEDGLPRGESNYGETLFALSRQVVAPDSVTVLKDGSDGGEAVVRSSGVLQNVAFLDPFRGLLPFEYDFPAAIDYVLKPGDDHVTVRYSVINWKEEAVDFSGRENFGFFHSYTSQLYTPAGAFGLPREPSAWLAYEGRTAPSVNLNDETDDPRLGAAFSVKALGSPLKYGAAVSGFEYFVADGFKVDACAQSTVDFAELTAAPGGLDGLRAAIEPQAATVAGTVREATGEAVAGAWVFVVGANGVLYTRTRTDASGHYEAHAPAGSTLTVFAEGHEQPAAVPVGPQVDVTLPAVGYLSFRVTDADTNAALPVRIQVIPKVPPPALPATYGVAQPPGGALEPRFALNGEARFVVPPGEHRVVVSRGYEYEVLDETFTVAAGQTAGKDVQLVHSVDSTGIMCADFHIHANLSFDSDDVVRAKVASAVADGLEIPVSSEHEWIADFLPTIQDLGLSRWAYSFPSQELTTFGNGHMGVVPLVPRPERRNNGAIHWIGKHLGDVFAEVRALPEKPVLIINHPSTGGFLGYFLTVGFDPATAAGTGEEWTENFEAIEVFNDSTFDANRAASVRDWFALLSAGKKFFAVGNSDSHHIKTSPVGYPRTCFEFGHDDPAKLSMEGVRDALRTGNGTISGGILLGVKGPAGQAPWQSVPGGGAFTVRVQAPSWVGVKELEVIVDGTVTETIPLTTSDDAGPGKHFTRTVSVAPPPGGGTHWVVFHVRGEGVLAPLHPERAPFAVTNPFFL